MRITQSLSLWQPIDKRVGTVKRLQFLAHRRLSTCAGYCLPGDWSDRDGDGQRLRYLPIRKRRLADVQRANARRERWFAILANFLKAHRALGFFLKRKSQIHRGRVGYLSGLWVIALFPILGHNRGPHRFNRGRNRRLVKHGKEPPLIASLYQGRPSIGALCRRMPGKAKNMDNTFPNGVAAKRLFDRHRLENRSLAAVLRFNGTFQFGGAYVHDMQFRADVPQSLTNLKR